MPAQTRSLLPFSSVDLPAERTFFISPGNHHIKDGQNPRDFSVAESSSSQDTSAGSGNSAHYIYGVPVYIYGVPVYPAISRRATRSSSGSTLSTP